MDKLAERTYSYLYGERIYQDICCLHSNLKEDLTPFLDFYVTKCIVLMKEKKGNFLPGSFSIWTASLVLELSMRFVLEGPENGEKSGSDPE